MCVIEGLLIGRLIYMQTPAAKQKYTMMPSYSFMDSVYIDKKTTEERREKMQENQELLRNYPDLPVDFGLITAKGTWMSDTEIANKANTVVLQCWKEFDHCFVSQAEIADYGGLYLGTDLYEITKWGLDEVRATSGTAFGCFSYDLTLDRMNQKVTSVRKKIGDDGMCEGTSDKPLMIFLK